MIKSMTSFGRASFEAGPREYLVEIKTVNHKYNDISIKINRNLSYMEDNIRKLILNYISRGKIEVYIEVSDYSEDGKQIKINKELVKSYINELNELALENNILNDMSVMNILKLPDVLKIKSGNDIIEQEIIQCVTQALENLMEMRLLEGNKIAQDIENRLDILEEKIKQIEIYSKDLVPKYKQKLEERIKEILDNDLIDKNRLAQEVVIYSDKTSIQEELTRFKSHCNQFRKSLSATGNIGKKLDFIVQEMNREINTIASKANCINITDLVIEVKTEVENVREQIQNIQ